MFQTTNQITPCCYHYIPKPEVQVPTIYKAIYKFSAFIYHYVPEVPTISPDTFIVIPYGSVSKPCTPGEHQNSW